MSWVRFQSWAQWVGSGPKIWAQPDSMATLIIDECVVYKDLNKDLYYILDSCQSVISLYR